MIDVSELRIGNLFTRDDYNMVVTHLQKSAGTTWVNHVQIDFTDEAQAKKLCDPITLTEKWLERFEFEWHGGSDKYWDKGGFKLWCGNNIAKEFYHMNDQTLTWFGSVHHLQNYYHALTGGKELTTKEEIR